jgi:hypothetical protein
LNRRKVFANCTSDKVFIARIYREYKNQNYPKSVSDSMDKWTNELNRAFSKEKVQLAKNHMKKYAQHP